MCHALAFRLVSIHTVCNIICYHIKMFLECSYLGSTELLVLRSWLKFRCANNRSCCCKISFHFVCSCVLMFLCGFASYVDVMKQLQKAPEDVSESKSQDNSQDNMVTGQSPYSKHKQSSKQASQSGLASSPWSSKSSGVSGAMCLHAKNA